MDYSIKGQSSTPPIFEQLKNIDERVEFKRFSFEKKVTILSEKFLLVYRKTNDPVSSIALKEKRSGFIGHLQKAWSTFLRYCTPYKAERELLDGEIAQVLLNRYKYDRTLPKENYNLLQAICEQKYDTVKDKTIEGLKKEATQIETTAAETFEAINDYTLFSWQNASTLLKKIDELQSSMKQIFKKVTSLGKQPQDISTKDTYHVIYQEGKKIIPDISYEVEAATKLKKDIAQLLPQELIINNGEEVDIYATMDVSHLRKLSPKQIKDLYQKASSSIQTLSDLQAQTKGVSAKSFEIRNQINDLKHLYRLIFDQISSSLIQKKKINLTPQDQAFWTQQLQLFLEQETQSRQSFLQQDYRSESFSTKYLELILLNGALIPENIDENVRISILENAAQYGSFEVVKQFFPSKEVMTPFTRERLFTKALEGQNKQIIEFLIDKLAIDVSKKLDGYSDPPLFIAARRGKIQSILVLLEKDANIFKKNDEKGNNVFHSISLQKLNPELQEELLKLFIKNGGNLNDRNESGQTALSNAIELNDYSLSFLLSSQRDHMDEKTINKALQIAVEKLIEGNGNYSSLSKLIDNIGAPISRLPPSIQFRYALFISKDTSAIDVLVKNGFIIAENLTPKDFERIVSEASSILSSNNKHDALLSYLIKNNVDTGLLSEKSQWFAAVITNDQKKLETLLNKEYGDDQTEVVPKEDLLKLALSRVITKPPQIKMVKTIQLLLKKGADPERISGIYKFESEVFCAVLQEDQKRLNKLLTRNSHIEKAQEYANFLFEHGIIKSRKTAWFKIG